MGSAEEAKVGASHANGTEAIPIQAKLKEIRHPQLPNPIQVDNTTVVGFENCTLKQTTSKAIGMRFYWIQDRSKQGQFIIYWRTGAHNLKY